jgi:sialic acid synthase SpsE
MEIVAEFTYNHFGNIDRAKQMIGEAKNAGATCVKFEIRNSENYFKNNPEIQQKKRSFEFNDQQIMEFVLHCQQEQIGWFASVHDIHSLRRILPFHPKYIKVASREARVMDFLVEIKKINENKIPVIVSTGGLSFEEVEKIYGLFKDQELWLLHTNCIYPCPVEKLNMNRIRKMKVSFNCKIGYSGHEEGFMASLYAATLGADYIERHFTLNDQQDVAKGKPSFEDDRCTLSPLQFKEMADAVNLITQLYDQPLREEIAPEELERINAYGNIGWDGEDVFLHSPLGN